MNSRNSASPETVNLDDGAAEEEALNDEAEEEIFSGNLRRRSLLLPRAMTLNREILSFDQMAPELLREYSTEKLVKGMKKLDSLIAMRLTASERQRKFNELANFEQMAKENLKIEKKIREDKRREEEESKEREIKRRERKSRKSRSSRNFRTSRHSQDFRDVIPS